MRVEVNAFNQKNFSVSQLNNLFLYFSPFQSYFTLTVYCQEYSVFVHLKEILFIRMQSCTKPSHLTGELLS